MTHSLNYGADRYEVGYEGDENLNFKKKRWIINATIILWRHPG